MKLSNNNIFLAVVLIFAITALSLSAFTAYQFNGFTEQTAFNANVEKGIEAYAKKMQEAQMVAQRPPAPAEPVDVSLDDDAIKGNADAPVTIVEFSEYQCPYCGAAEGTNEKVMQSLKSRDPNWEAPIPRINELIKEGKVKLVMRDFIVHESARKASEATECAGEQGKFWEMNDILFANQSALSVNDLKGYAKEIGLNTTKFDQCLDGGQMAEEVVKDTEDGRKYGVRGTPAFFINGRLLSGAQPFAAFEALIEEELNR